MIPINFSADINMTQIFFRTIHVRSSNMLFGGAMRATCVHWNVLWRVNENIKKKIWSGVWQSSHTRSLFMRSYVCCVCVFTSVHVQPPFSTADFAACRKKKAIIVLPYTAHMLSDIRVCMMERCWARVAADWSDWYNLTGRAQHTRKLYANKWIIIYGMLGCRRHACHWRCCDVCVCVCSTLSKNPLRHIRILHVVMTSWKIINEKSKNFPLADIWYDRSVARRVRKYVNCQCTWGKKFHKNTTRIIVSWTHEPCIFQQQNVYNKEEG